MTRWRYSDRRWYTWHIHDFYAYVIICSYSALYNYWYLPYKLFNIRWICRQSSIINDDQANIVLGSRKIWLHCYFQDTSSQLHHRHTKSASSLSSSFVDLLCIVPAQSSSFASNSVGSGRSRDESRLFANALGDAYTLSANDLSLTQLIMRFKRPTMLSQASAPGDLRTYPMIEKSSFLSPLINIWYLSV